MELLIELFELFLHLDDYLAQIISQYGIWTYALLFFVIFMETGFVVTPFLPGDSLLFAAGSFAALGVLSPWWLVVLMSAAAVLGDSLNYAIGHYIGPKAFSGNIRFLKKEHLEKTQDFYDKHGGVTIILARFIPIVRTFAPFVAGIGTMHYGKFITYNVIGGVLWVNIFVWLGYFFGNIPFVKENFEITIVLIILISLLPMLYEYIAAKMRKPETEETEA
jgi:membrane-associated protein